MHDRDRAAPIALPGDQPVADPILHRSLADALLLYVVRDAFESRFAVEAVELAAVDHDSRLDMSAVDVARGVRARWHDHPADGQVELTREIEVALVVRGNGHDRAGAVRDQHVIGNPDRHLLAVEGLDRIRTGGSAKPPDLARHTIDLALLARRLDYLGDRPPLLGDSRLIHPRLVL